MFRLFSTLLLVAAVSFSALAENRALPFGVNIGGHNAALTEASENHAVIATPVAADAALTVKDVEGQVIVNLWPTNAAGEEEPNAQPLVLLFDASGSKSLSDNMQGQKPRAGYHLANVVAGGKTSRVVFQVK